MKTIAGRPAADYHREYDRRRYLNAVQKFLEYLGGRCAGCGVRERLEFHHVDARTKQFSILRRWRWSLEDLKPELDKCILLCHGCHRAVSAQEKAWSNHREGNFECPCGKTYLDRLQMAGHRRWCTA